MLRAVGARARGRSPTARRSPQGGGGMLQKDANPPQAGRPQAVWRRAMEFELLHLEFGTQPAPEHPRARGIRVFSSKAATRSLGRPPAIVTGVPPPTQEGCVCAPQCAKAKARLMRDAHEREGWIQRALARLSCLSGHPRSRPFREWLRVPRTSRSPPPSAAFVERGKAKERSRIVCTLHKATKLCPSLRERFWPSVRRHVRVAVRR